MAAAIDEADRTGEAPRPVLDRLARRLGTDIGDAARCETTTADPVDTVVGVLAANGFEPRRDDTDIVLGNCPFHALARSHTALVCGMNLCLIEGLLCGLTASGVTARLNPTPGNCCVRLHAE